MRVSTFQCFSLSHLCTNIVSSPKFSACSVTGVASYFFSWKNEMSTFVALCFYLSWSCLAGACVSGHRVCLSIKFETGVHRGYAGGGFLFLRFSFFVVDFSNCFMWMWFKTLLQSAMGPIGFIAI